MESIQKRNKSKRHNCQFHPKLFVFRSVLLQVFITDTHLPYGTVHLLGFLSSLSNFYSPIFDLLNRRDHFQSIPWAHIFRKYFFVNFAL